MSLEFIGHTGSRSGAETIEASGPIIDKAYIKHMAHTAEANGFDRLLIGSFATWPDNWRRWTSSAKDGWRCT